MTWLLRSRDQSLRAKQARKAWAQGIILEPGNPELWASCSGCRPTKSGRNKNSPPQRVKNLRADSEKARTSAPLQRWGQVVEVAPHPIVEAVEQSPRP